LSLVGCGFDTHDKSVIYFGIAQKPKILDPRFASDAASEKINNLIYSSLFYYDNNFKMQSDIVNYQLVSTREYIFELKEDLPYFHNGSRLNIKDIIATLDNVMSDPMSPLAIEFKNIDKFVKLSDEQFSIFLKEADTNFVQKLNVAILPAKLINNNHNFSAYPIGLGRFRFISSTNKIKIERIKDGQIIEFIEIKDPTVRALKLLKGEIDIVQNDLPVEVVNFLENQSSIIISSAIGSNISYIGFNFNDSLLKDIRLRQAIAKAINREELVKYFLDENTRLAEQLFAPEHWVSENLNNTNFNPEQARKLIKSISPLSPISLTYKTSTDPFRLKIATIIQNQLAQVGINLTIKTLDWGTYFQDIQNGNFQMYGLTWVGIKNPDIYYKIFHSESIPPKGLNRGYFKSLKIDNLLKSSFMSNDWSEVILEIQNQVGFLPLWFEGNIAAHSKQISNYKVHNDGNWDGLKNIRKHND
jgi:peptide/nickel transport system substrate-binding protein